MVVSVLLLFGSVRGDTLKLNVYRSAYRSRKSEREKKRHADREKIWAPTLAANGKQGRKHKKDLFQKDRKQIKPLYK